MIIQRARLVAELAHKGQFRRDGVTPYLTHPAKVADGVEHRLKPIAWLHDVVEDTILTLEDLRTLGFPDYVVDAVGILTRRGEDYDEYIHKLMTNRDAVAVKIADMEHNMSCQPSANSIAKINKWLPVLKACL